MDPAFLKALRGQSLPVVFGLRLKELTLGHAFVLEEINCPFISEDEATPTFSDVAAAVFVCSQSPQQARKGLLSWWFPIFFRIWSWRIKPDWWMHDIQAFQKYMAASFSSPEIRPARRGDIGSTQTCRSPSLMVKLFFALHILGMSESEAMATSVVRLNCLYATWADWSGNGELVDSVQMNELRRFAEEKDRLKYNPDGTRKIDNLN